MKTPQYKCPSYVNDDNELVDCACGKCAKTTEGVWVEKKWLEGLVELSEMINRSEYPLIDIDDPLENLLIYISSIEEKL
jgi:hypothetical protein